MPHKKWQRYKTMKVSDIFWRNKTKKGLLVCLQLCQLEIMECNWVKKNWVKHQEIISNENRNWAV